MHILSKLINSSVGKKFIMALTGLALILFVVGHMVGNLQVFLDPKHINAYAHFLQDTPELLWGARLGLLACVGLHIWSAFRLSAENKAARPTGYTGDPKPKAASYASRTMLMSGLIILSFIIYHLLHYTVCIQAINFTGKDFNSFRELGTGYHDVHKMIVTGFSNPLVSGFYLLSVFLLCLHLSHGISALFQSLGIKTPAWSCTIETLAKVASIAIFAGYAVIPLSVLLHLVK